MSIFIAINSSSAKNLDEVRNIQNSEIIDAIMNNDIQSLLKFLSDKGDINARTYLGNTALTAAASVCQQDMVSQLLAHNANINARNNEGDTALIIVSRTKAENARCQSTVSQLLDHKADINIRGRSGQTALLVAIENSNLPVISKLLSLQADINVRDDFGLTALSLAVEKKNKEIILQLISKGANINGDDRSILSSPAITEDPEMVSFLLEKGADTNIQDENGETSLMLAVEGRLRPGPYASPEEAKAQEETRSALRAQVVSALLAKKANVNLRDKQGNTALMRAVMNPYNSLIVTQLLNHGADVKIRNNQGQTALDRALMVNKNENNQAIISLLKRSKP
jgi:ankyrin repeat protein